MRPHDSSLRRRLLVRLWVPLACVLLIGALSSFGLAFHVGNKVHDRWLLDSAMTLATQVRGGADRLSLDLPPSAVEMFEWDSMDHIYEEVTSSSGGRLFGNAVFPAASAQLSPNEPRFYDSMINGKIGRANV